MGLILSNVVEDHIESVLVMVEIDSGVKYELLNFMLFGFAFRGHGPLLQNSAEMLIELTEYAMIKVITAYVDAAKLIRMVDIYSKLEMPVNFDKKQKSQITA